MVRFTGLLLGLSGTDLVSWVLLMSDDSWSQETPAIICLLNIDVRMLCAASFLTEF